MYCHLFPCTDPRSPGRGTASAADAGCREGYRYSKVTSELWHSQRSSDHWPRASGAATRGPWKRELGADSLKGGCKGTEPLPLRIPRVRLLLVLVHHRVLVRVFYFLCILLFKVNKYLFYVCNVLSVYMCIQALLVPKEAREV